jgi:hypothetical protein
MPINTRGPRMDGVAIRLHAQLAANDESSIPQPHAIAELQPKPIEHRALGHQPMIGQRRRDGAGRHQFGSANQRPGAVHGLQFHQQPVTARCRKQRPHPHRVRNHGSLALKECQQILRQLLRAALDLQIAAENAPAIL